MLMKNSPNCLVGHEVISMNEFRPSSLLKMTEPSQFDFLRQQETDIDLPIIYELDIDAGSWIQRSGIQPLRRRSE
jgi:hypothetical protein